MRLLKIKPSIKCSKKQQQQISSNKIKVDCTFIYDSNTMWKKNQRQNFDSQSGKNKFGRIRRKWRKRGKKRTHNGMHLHNREQVSSSAVERNNSGNENNSSSSNRENHIIMSNGDKGTRKMPHLKKTTQLNYITVRCRFFPLWSILYIMVCVLLRFIVDVVGFLFFFFLFILLLLSVDASPSNFLWAFSSWR